MSLVLNSKSTYSGKYKSIILQTYEGNNIENSQLSELSAFEINQFRDYENIQGVSFKGEPTPVFNCHGLTFASRRTWIEHSKLIRQILDEDKYVEVSRNGIEPGDVFIYIIEETGDIIHSGIVLDVSRDSLLSIKVISKWGKYKEAIHDVYQNVYQKLSTDKFEVKFYRVKHSYRLSE